MSDQFQITKAVRKGAPALVGLWGPSGSGKTFTALHIARGLVGPKGKIGLIDTENRRAEFYAELAGGWDHLDLQPPYSPRRYTDAFLAFEEAGNYGCVIVDSASHVWEGEGGVLDMADNAKTSGGAPLQGLARWKTPKMDYKRMVNTLLRAPFHVIFCLRAKDGVKQIGGGSNAKIESVGAQPIIGKGLIYEMTVAALLGLDHAPAIQGDGQLLKCDPLIPAVKAPEALKDIFRSGQPLGVETGEKIARWVAGGAVFDVDRAKLERVARDVATMGSDRLKQHWEGLTREEKLILKPIMEEVKAIAAEADTQFDTDPDYEGQEEEVTL